MPISPGIKEDKRIDLPPGRTAPFLKTRERYGQLSNMASGFPLHVAGLTFSGSEALYQSLKYPEWPVMQQMIAAKRGGMAAKRLTRNPDLPPVRDDWNGVKKSAMMAALAEKLAQHGDRFGQALLETEDRLIIEVSYKDRFWGAGPQRDGTYVGSNVLGRMLTRLRDELLQADGNAEAAAGSFIEFIPELIRNEALLVNGKAPWRLARI